MFELKALTKEGRKTISEVKEALHVDSLVNIPQTKIIEFANGLKDMDPDLALKCIENVPNFADFSNTIISHFDDVCNDLAKDSRKDSIAALHRILGDLSVVVNKKRLPKDLYKYTIDQMIYVAQKIAEEEDKKDRFKKTVIAATGAVTALGIGAVSAAVGVVTKGKIGRD